jgi:hypothetical protein
MGDSWTVVHGKWTERVPAGTEGAVPRVLTKGKNEGSTVYEIGWPSLTDLVLVSGQFVKPQGFSSEQVELNCKDAKTGEGYLLSLPADSKYLKKFIMCLPKLDPTRPFNLELHMARNKTPTGEDKFNLRIIQDGKSLDTHYFLEWKKDEKGNNVTIYHNGCPPPKELRGGKYNFDDQDEFLCQYLEEFFKDYEHYSHVPQSEENGGIDHDDVPSDDEGEDDIPF